MYLRLNTNTKYLIYYVNTLSRPYNIKINNYIALFPILKLKLLILIINIRV
jgi:hypothetical protein